MDNISMISEGLQPHQLRVVEEHNELVTKIKSLTEFILNSEVFKSLDAAEQSRLRNQESVMIEYAKILSVRIENFVIA